MICTLNTVKMVAGREKAFAREWRGSKISKNLEIFIRCFCQEIEAKRSQPFLTSSQDSKLTAQYLRNVAMTSE